MTRLSPCITSIGPRDARIVAVGEAPGEQEERTGVPFIGSAGQEFDRMLQQAGLRRADLYLTNVLWTRPPDNKLENFCVKRTDLPPGYDLPPLRQGLYLHPEFVPELARLGEELRNIKPNLILLLGSTASWAVLHTSAITKIRGTVIPCEHGKCLATYHPAYILRDWSARPIVIADLIKAERESHFPDIRRPKRQVLISPTLTEALSFLSEALTAPAVSIDVETRGGTITHLGIAVSPQRAICIPFISPPRPDNLSRSYWSVADELRVRRHINTLLSSPIHKVFQNGLYDIQYLLKEKYKLRLPSHDDTMLAHHALHPELQKALGFMGSIYTDEGAWKMLAVRSKTLKRED